HTEFVKVDSGVLLPNFIKECMKVGISCLEQLYCIPGTIGGAVYVNAGIPSFEISDVLISIECIDKTNGTQVFLTRDNINMKYRNGNIHKNLIITSAKLKTSKADMADLKETIRKIQKKRFESQPIGMPTCGSTFKNPPGLKAWQLIKESNCDRLSVGGAAVSDKHCNFLINTGNATASDFYNLIQTIKEVVSKKTGILLEEEIIIIGKY
ncbi:MAG: UDP-N-acetylmuramate dehydrogenase, partial [Holosporales bacterium]|nr:UDP-N-acetylmuramate dehydrogenase [Holosporales bacterium]